MSAKGYECVLTIGVSTVGKAKNFDPTYSAAELDYTTRDSAGWKEREGGMKEWAGSIEMLWVPTDTALAVLWAAYIAGTAVTVEWVDADGYGRSGDAIITSFHPGPQDLDNEVWATIELASTGAVTSVTPAT